MKFMNYELSNKSVPIESSFWFLVFKSDAFCKHNLHLIEGKSSLWDYSLLAAHTVFCVQHRACPIVGMQHIILTDDCALEPWRRKR